MRTDRSSSEPSPRSNLRPALVIGIALYFVAGGLWAAASPGGDRSGKEVVEAVCSACHGTGVNGAPKIGDQEAWSKRASQGLTGLTQSALQGIRQMPAHGGHPELSDVEVGRAVT